MATVVHVPKDTRAEDLGSALGRYLVGLKENRIDKVQRELLDAISKAPDESTAAALMGDPKYQDVVTDPVRFPQVITHLNNTPLGFQSLIGYTPGGEQKIISYNPGKETPEDVYAREGLSPTASQLYFAVDLENDVDVPTPIGRFRSPGEAKESLPAGRNPDSTTMMNAQELSSFIQNRNSSLSAEDQRLMRMLSQDRFKFAKDAGKSPFGQLAQDFQSGIIDQNQFVQAWERLVAVYGRSAHDVQKHMIDEMVPRAAKVQAFSEQGVKIMRAVQTDPSIITSSAGIPEFFRGIGSEIATIAQELGWDRKPLESYNAVFEEAGLGTKNRVLKTVFLDMAILYGSLRGQEGRSLSDTDLKLFLEAMGKDIRNADTFLTNMNLLIGSSQNMFNREYQAYNQITKGSPNTWEQDHGAFTKWKRDDSAAISSFVKDMNEKYGFELVLPGN